MAAFQLIVKMTELSPIIQQQFALFNLIKRTFAIMLSTHGPNGAGHAFDIAQIIDRHVVNAYAGKSVNEGEIMELIEDFIEAVKTYSEIAAIMAAVRRSRSVYYSMN